MNAILQSAAVSLEDDIKPNVTHTRSALRFLTAGSVDDGKSTLIGRLLFDSRAVLADQLHTLQARAVGQAQAAGAPDFDLSLLTDGLEAEREQGITIDVAYRYFATPQRKFIIADAPGHEQYTRNMVTAAAGSDAVVVLIDVTKLDITKVKLDSSAVTLLPQTRRHSLLAQLLRVPSVVFAVNKIDAVADPAAAFAAVQKALALFAQEAGFAVAAVVPVSALRGDNVTQPLRTPWYQGPSLLQVLEGLPNAVSSSTQSASADTAFSLPVQYVARNAGGAPGVGEQPRVLWGRIAQGRVQVGDELQVYPSGERATVQTVLSHRTGSSTQHHVAGNSVGIVLNRQLDVSRGDWLSAAGSTATATATATATQRFTATLAWLDTEPATPGRKYLLRHGHRWVQARLVAVQQRLDVHTLQNHKADQLGVNDIGQVVFEAQHPLPLAPYATHSVAGSLIVVDPSSHRTSGALLVQSCHVDEASA
jgi:sulfate adenylyltransferase subunit 1